MKVESKKLQNNSFKPFVLNLTVETEDEARALYAIFNNTDNLRLFHNSSTGVTDVLKQHGTFTTKYREVIANEITYEQFYGCN
jgi:hypothetical protein